MGKLEDNINSIIYEKRFELLKRNIRLNKSYIKNTIDDIYGKAYNKDFIIVAAGPSFDANIDILKEYEESGNFIIIYVDMVLRSAIKAGLKPKLVISTEGIDVDYWNDIDTKEMILLAASCISHGNLLNWVFKRGDIYFYSWLIDGKFNRLWEMVPDVPQLPTGGIITTIALSFAVGCFTKNIILIGNDLAYPKGQQYCKGAIGEGWNKYDYIIKQDGKEYYTTGNFAIAKMWMERFIDGYKNNINFYDLSEPGLFNTKKLRRSYNGTNMASGKQENKRSIKK